jgi:hypothetical protein
MAHKPPAPDQFEKAVEAAENRVLRYIETAQDIMARSDVLRESPNDPATFCTVLRLVAEETRYLEDKP